MGPKCSWLFLFQLICVIDSIKGFSRFRGYWSILLSICRAYIYMCSPGYFELAIVLLYLLRCLVYHMLSKTRRNSRSLHRVIAYILYSKYNISYFEVCSAGYAELPVVLLYLLQCLVYHMLSKTRRSSGSLHRVIGEVLVLGLLVVVYKIPYSSCM